jgi:hypothetical protein
MPNEATQVHKFAPLTVRIHKICVWTLYGTLFSLYALRYGFTRSYENNLASNFNRSSLD